MATVVYNSAFDITTFDFAALTSGSLSATSTNVHASSGIYSADLAGSYTVIGGFPVAGTINGIAISASGSPLITVTGENLSVTQVYNDRHDTAALENDFFGGKDKISGSSGNDGMAGFGGNDKMKGGGGDDIIIGGAGGDQLTGGGGHDKFVYENVSDSIKGGVDLITDIAKGDKIDLHAIDADGNAGNGDTAFMLVAAFGHHAGELMVSAYDAVNDITVVSADIDGNGKADLVINLTGDHHDFTAFVL